jgi:hypothetical protein
MRLYGLESNLKLFTMQSYVYFMKSRASSSICYQATKLCIATMRQPSADSIHTDS